MTAPTLGEFTAASLRIGCLGFGGPAGQIALMHRIRKDYESLALRAALINHDNEVFSQTNVAYGGRGDDSPNYVNLSHHLTVFYGTHSTRYKVVGPPRVTRTPLCTTRLLFIFTLLQPFIRTYPHLSEATRAPPRAPRRQKARTTPVENRELRFPGP